MIKLNLFSSRKNREHDTVQCDGSDTEFPSERFQGRLYGFCWVLLERRDPEYDSDKLKNEHQVLWVLKAMDFADEEEKEVITKLVDVVKARKSTNNDRLAMLGAVEGKAVEYKHLSPETLLSDEDI